MLAGCSGSQPQPGLLGATANAGRTAARAGRDTSWILPEATQHTLLYISTATAGVYVYDYPSRRIVGTLTDAITPQGLCSDAAGNVFVSDASGQQVLEYAHGGSAPVKRLTGAGYPISCAVDPRSGNLAVASDTSAISIFFKAKGRPKLVNDPGANFWFCAYDSKGNLFANDDFPKHHQIFIGELPRGSSTFKNLKLDRLIKYPLGIQWYDGYLALGDTTDNKIYQVRVSNSDAKLVLTTRLVGAKDTRQFTFYRNKLISPDPSSDFAGIWSYPAGGGPLRKIDGIFGEPLGSAISEP